MGLHVTGEVSRSTWTALLVRGVSAKTKLVKVGTGGNEVRRVQRALNAATGARLRVDGVFGRGDMEAVGQYQRRVGLRRTGVVGGSTWRALRHGVTADGWTRGGRKVAGLQPPRSWLPVPFGSGARSPERVEDQRAR